ncbi:MAG: hypothetical protein ACI840_000488 [Ulvibacter sp.]
MIKKLLLLLFSISIISCNSSEERAVDYSWIGGEIVNPHSDYVLLFKNNYLLDTIKLNSKNFFSYKTENKKGNLYSFRNGEFQIFYLEPGDSLMLRVNTIDFDESLSYSGIGAEKNNFLMELFLMNEIDRKLVTTWYSLSPEDYEFKLDSLKEIQTKLYSEFTSKEKPTTEFIEIADASIDYAYNANKELYTTINFMKFQSEDYTHEGFYDYRKDVDFGSNALQSYYPYYYFLDWYLDNISFEKYFKKSKLDRKSFTHNYHKLKIIDSLITNDSLRNNMLYSLTRRCLVNGSDPQEETQILKLFLAHNNNPKQHTEMKELARAAVKLTSGNKIPNVLLVNSENTVKDLHSIISKPTVLFFWSSLSVKHYRNMHSKAVELSKKYPEYDFLGINTDTHFKKWRSIVLQSGYNKASEFQFDDIEDAQQKLVINSANKAIILDKDGSILQNNSSLFSTNIESLLLGYVNK